MIAHADRILKGAPPGDLPVQEPTRFELILNGKAARTIGLTFPKDFLIQATEVIQ